MVALYRCRLCGETFEDFHTGRKNAHLIAMGFWTSEISKLPMRSQGFYRHISHHCNDGSLGLADFIGFRKEEGDEEG